MIRYALLLLFAIPLLLGFRVFPGGNRWSIAPQDPTLWIQSCRELSFTSATFHSGDALADAGIPSYRTTLQSIVDDFNNIPGAYIRLARYPDDPENPPPPAEGDSPFSTAAARLRTIKVCFEDQTITAGHARPQWHADGYVIGCEIKLNTDTIQKAEDFVSVLTHELGHCLGLDHPQETDDAVMSYFSSALRLQIDDKMGLTQLYPMNSGSRESSSFGLACSPR